MRDEEIMKRCFQLARLGEGFTSPNPLVGAVLVHKDRIIGEGYHQKYGMAHAEVNAVNDVKSQDRHLIPEASLYVSLEPCCNFGRTPPCTDLILREKIKKVFVSVIDYTAEVKGLGIQKLRNAGVEVKTGVLAAEGAELSIVRNTFVARNRPFVALKFARTSNGYMGMTGKQVWISNNYSKRLSHKMRNQFGGILVGTNTAVTDNPSLNNRLWFGTTPVKVLIDRDLKVEPHSRVFQTEGNTIIFSECAPSLLTKKIKAEIITLPFDEDFLPQLLAELAHRNVTSLLVEGGAQTIGHFLRHELWDEAWVFTSDRNLSKGIATPRIDGVLKESFQMGNDMIKVIHAHQRCRFSEEIATLSIRS